jgi:hypothetical protein
MLLTLYFTIVVALPLALGIYVLANGVQRSRVCPSCANDTFRLQATVHRLISRFLRSTELHLRWCVTCGWRGTVQLRRAPMPPRPARQGRSGGTARIGGSEHVDVRTLEIDGRPWRVMIQCWAEGSQWVGRLLFVAPDGRTCMEEASSLEGDSAMAVLSEALCMPDTALAGRLRRAIH